jgi:hypothetical protein
MARSSYIYLVMPRTGQVPVGAFTVKHELEKFLDGHGRDVQIFRIRDGLTVKESWMKYNPVEQLDATTLKKMDEEK